MINATIIQIVFISLAAFFVITWVYLIGKRSGKKYMLDLEKNKEERARLDKLAIGERQKAREEEMVKRSKQEKILKGQLNDYIDELAETFKEMYPQPFKEGDAIILNRYAIGKDGNNSWDGGPSALYGYCVQNNGGDDLVLKGVVRKVFPSYSIMFDMVERFLASNYEGWDMYCAEPNSSKLRNDFMETLGEGAMPNSYARIYWEVYFDTNCNFNPAWGLNACSWLLADSEEGRKTEEIWLREIALDAELKAVRLKKQELQKRKEEFDEQYNNVKVIKGY